MIRSYELRTKWKAQMSEATTAQNVPTSAGVEIGAGADCTTGRPGVGKRRTRAIGTILLLFGLASSALAQPVATIAPAAKPQFFSDAGAVCAACKLYTYTVGTTTPLDTCADSSMSAAATCTTANANPVILDSAGRGSIYLIPGLTYKFILKSAADATIWTQDQIGSLQHVSIDRLRLATKSVTIATGAITVSESQYTVDTEGAAAADDLDTITTSTATGTGSILILTPANVSHVVTAKDSTGNLRLAGGDFALDSVKKSLTLLYNGSNWVEVARAGQGNGLDNGSCEGRITLTTALPVTTADVLAATTVRFTPYKGNRCAFFDGSTWIPATFSELSLALGADAADTNYDLFYFDNAGVRTLERLAWTNATTRATALVLQDGVWVKTGVTTRKYLGTYRTTGVVGQTEDSYAKRFVWNFYNRVPRGMRVLEPTNTWTYTTNTTRQANGSTVNQLAFVVGIAEVWVKARIKAFASNATVTQVLQIGVGVDSTTTITPNNIGIDARLTNAGAITALETTYEEYSALGFHFWAWLENDTTATGTTTWYGDNNTPTLIQAAIFGELQG